MKSFLKYLIGAVFCSLFLASLLLVTGSVYLIRSLRSTVQYSVPEQAHVINQISAAREKQAARLAASSALSAHLKTSPKPADLVKTTRRQRNPADTTLHFILRGNEILADNPSFDACQAVCNESSLAPANRRDWMEFAVKYYESAGPDALMDPKLATFLMFCDVFEEFFPVKILSALAAFNKNPSYFEDLNLALQVVWKIQKIGFAIEEKGEEFKAKMQAVADFRKLNRQCLSQEVSPTKAFNQCRERLDGAGL